jgi:uncharacterized coiled-coil protein SlyX
MDEPSVEQIELKIAHLEYANAALSDMVYRQGREIRDLTVQLHALAAQFASQSAADSGAEKPPHY